MIDTGGAVIAAGLAGVAVFLGVLGSRAALAARLAADEAWLAHVANRFTPDPFNARLWAVVYNVARLVALLLLLDLFGFVIGTGAWILLLLLPRQVVEILWRRRREKIGEQIPTAVAAMANNIHAGLTLVQSIQRLAERAQDPIRTEFQVMANRYALGVNLEQTVLEAKARLALPDFNLFASALLINREMGGDVAKTLDRISRSIAKLHEMRQTVRASTSEGRTNIRVLLVTPLGILLMLYGMDPEGVTLLFGTPQGWLILISAAVLVGTGVFWASKIVGEAL